MKHLSLYVVASSRSEPYSVVLSDENKKIALRCDCPAGKELALCKHVIGVLAGDRSFIARPEQTEDFEATEQLAREYGLYEKAVQIRVLQLRAEIGANSLELNELKKMKAELNVLAREGCNPLVVQETNFRVASERKTEENVVSAIEAIDAYVRHRLYYKSSTVFKLLKAAVAAYKFLGVAGVIDASGNVERDNFKCLKKRNLTALSAKPLAAAMMNGYLRAISLASKDELESKVAVASLAAMLSLRDLAGFETFPVGDVTRLFEEMAAAGETWPRKA